MVCSECGAKVAYYRDGNYIYFGEYPQSIKDDGVTITETQDSRGYYLGSDGNFYAKVVAKPDGSGYMFSTGVTVTDGETYYFMVEPIRWRILSTDGETALILCDSIIAHRAYQSSYKYNYSYSSYCTTANGAPSGTYANNYEYSGVRAWLNSIFYETAFSELQRGIIVTTTVDNSHRTMGCYDSNPYACEATEDNIFLLSYEEVTNGEYGFSNDGDREMQTSDYSRATGAWMSTSPDYYGNAHWWLRSPSGTASEDVRYVKYDGAAGYTTSCGQSFIHVVPALQIRL